MDAPANSPAAPPESSIWRVVRWPYALIFVVSYLALGGFFYLVYKEPDAVPALAFFGAPFAACAWRSLWVCLFSSTYRLTHDRLDIVGPGGSKSLPLRDVTALISTARIKGRHASISIATPDTIQLIPRWLDKSSHDFFVELSNRIFAQTAALHLRDAQLDYPYDQTGNPLPPEKWARYPRIPLELRALLDEVDAKGGGTGTMLFALSHRKPPSRAQRWTRRYLAWFIVLTLVGSAIGLTAQRFNNRGTYTIAYVVMAGFALFFLGLTYVVRNTPKSKSEWFVLHPFGLAMMGQALTGELAWSGIQRINLTASRPVIQGPFETRQAPVEHFHIETPDGARIGVMDVYDVPVCIIGEFARIYFEKYRNPTPNLEPIAAPHSTQTASSDISTPSSPSPENKPA